MATRYQMATIAILYMAKTGKVRSIRDR